MSACVRRFVATALLTIMLLIAGLAVHGSGAPDRLAQIERYVAAQAARAGIPALAYAVVQADQVVLAQGLGTAGQGPVGPDTVFEIGSLGKSITAAAILQLQEQGRLQLDDPVIRHLPAFRVANEEASQQITIRHLLMHTAGLPPAADWRMGSARMTERDAVLGLATVQLAAAPGAQHAYSNLGYAVLGQVIEAVGGQPYPAYVAERVLAPGMAHTTVDPARATALLGARPHAWRAGLLGQAAPMYQTHPYLAAAGASAVSSALDMARYLSAWLGHGEFLTAASRAAAQSGGVPTADGRLYALGWGHTRAYDTSVALHIGGTNGSASVMLLLPEHQLGVVVLGNLDTEAVATIGTGIVRLLLGQEPRDVPLWPQERVRSLAWLGLPLALGVVLVWLRARRRRGARQVA